MADTFKGIITSDGKKRQLPYMNVLETPVSDKTLSVEGGFADSKIVGNKFAKVDETTNSLKEDLGDVDNKFNEGINLYNKDAEMLHRFVDPNGNGANSESWRLLEIAIESNETYTFGGARIMTCIYDENGGVISGGNDSSAAYSIVMPENAKSIKVSCQTVDTDKVQIVKGGTLTQYIPYGFMLNTPHYYTKYEVDRIVYGNVLKANPSNYRKILESIIDSSYENQYLVLLENGVYDVLSMLTDVEKSDDNFYGLYIPKFTKIRGIANNVIIKLESPSLKGKLSAVNLDVTASIENCKVIASKCRYAIHDDWTERKWFNDETIPDYWTSAFEKGFEKICKNVSTEITESYVGASWGSGTVNSTKWIYKNCIIGKGNDYAYICHNDNSSVMGADVTLENCRVDGKIRFSSLNKGVKSDCFAHIVGTKSDGIDLTEENVDLYGNGIRWHIDGYANNINASSVTIVNTDDIDYSSNINLL